MDFDKFTNEYGFLREEEVGKNEVNSAIDIEWDRVAADYRGFYIDKDMNLEERDKIAFLKGLKHNSWMDMTGIKKGLIYIFKKE